MIIALQSTMIYYFTDTLDTLLLCFCAASH